MQPYQCIFMILTVVLLCLCYLQVHACDASLSIAPLSTSADILSEAFNGTFLCLRMCMGVWAQPRSTRGCFWSLKGIESGRAAVISLLLGTWASYHLAIWYINSFITLFSLIIISQVATGVCCPGRQLPWQHHHHHQGDGWRLVITEVSLPGGRRVLQTIMGGGGGFWFTEHQGSF